MILFDYLVLFACGLALIMAIGLFLRPLRFRNGIFACLLIISGFMNFFLYVFHTKLILKFPHIFFFQVPAALCLGPLVYFYILSLTDDKNSMTKKDRLHFIPALTLFLFMIPYISLPGNEKIEILKQVMNRDGYLSILYTGAASVSIMTVYSFTSIKIIWSRLKSGNPIQNIIKFFFVLLILILFVEIISVFYILTINFFLMRISNIIISFVILNLYLLSQRYPYLLQHGTIPVKKAPYSKSHLKRIDIKNLAENLKLLMEEDKFYCDEDITLGRLSDALEITPHQLSEFLNEHYKKNFNNFINSYRVEEAKKLLVEEPSRNTLSIAYASGFNSYSAFHSSFKKETGMSPADFRRKMLQNKT